MPLQFSRQALLLAAVLAASLALVADAPAPELQAEVARLRDGVHGQQHNETPLLGCCSNCSAVAHPPRLGGSASWSSGSLS
jgi:hypothetical protein